MTRPSQLYEFLSFDWKQCKQAFRERRHLHVCDLWHEYWYPILRILHTILNKQTKCNIDLKTRSRTLKSSNLMLCLTNFVIIHFCKALSISLLLNLLSVELFIFNLKRQLFLSNSVSQKPWCWSRHLIYYFGVTLKSADITMGQAMWKAVTPAERSCCHTLLKLFHFLSIW